MQSPGDNSITIVDPQTQTYADNNLNEKTMGTQYIYTTEGQLIPTTPEVVAANMDLNAQHFDTAQVTDAQGIHLPQVHYQYEQQFPDGTIQQVPPGGEQFVQNQEFVVTEASYMPDPQQNISTHIVTEATSEVAPYVYTTPQVQDTYVPSLSAVTTASYVANFDANSQESQPEVVEMEEKPDENNSTTAQTQEQLPTPVEEPQPTVDNTKEVETENHSVEEPTKEQPEVPEITEESVIEETNTSMETPEQANEVVIEDISNKEITKPNEEEIEKSTESSEAVHTDNKELEKVPEPIEVLGENVEVSSDITPNKDILNLNEGGSNIVEIVEEDIERDDENSTDTMETSDVQETMVIVYEDNSSQGAVSDEEEIYTVNEDGEVQEAVKKKRGSRSLEEQASGKSPRPRGRKPKTEIPLHILGHNVTKPVDSAVNGKSAPKPRLGVKVPYRNLTSQIVSKAEIEQEIMDRNKKKESKESAVARHLSARITKKFVPPSSDPLAVTESDISAKASAKKTPVEKTPAAEDDTTEESSKDKQTDSIENNSDLLAILEGNDVSEEVTLPLGPVASRESTESTPDESSLKNLEREIALQQLHDLPYLSPSTRFYKGKTCKTYLKEVPNLSLSDDGKPKITSNTKTTAGQTKNKEVGQKQAAKSPSKQNPDEPQIKVNMALKTYSRKRKSVDNVPEPQPLKKTPTISNAQIEVKTNIQSPPLNDGVYVTKSSRVIKKKVIWDPDETPTKSAGTKVGTNKPENTLQTKIIAKYSSVKSETKAAAEKSEKKAETKANTDKIVEDKQLPKKSPLPAAAEKKMSSASKVIQKPKKSRTEVDKLLGDEGTIKMLYELKNDSSDEKRKKTVISVERTFKDLAKKANLIKSDLVNNSSVESPKSLRKKDSAISPETKIKPTKSASPTPAPSPAPSGISRQKSKDSNRSTPPRSPTFPFPNETSYLIRRRSSSSLSSNGGSLDDDQERVLRRKTRSSPLNDYSKAKRVKKSSETKDQESETDTKNQKRVENRIGHYKTFNVKKINKSVTIDLHTADTTKGYFTLELLEELTTALNKISKEKDCNAVLVRSKQDKIFSLGLDYKTLVSDKENERKTKATKLSEQVSNFIKCLLRFPKVLIAGIEGECCGLAVTMLPLFDIVIASDTACFTTPFASLGAIAEAGFLLTVPYVPSHGLASELFYISQTLTADEAHRKGLITRLCWPEKYKDTVRLVTASVAKGSKQSLEATKRQLRLSIMESTETAIQSMKSQLVEFWTSPECQKNFSKIE